MKILIVEDNLKLLESIIKALVDEGFICETASNFALADDKVYLYQYDVLVIFALVDIVKSSASTSKKLLWVLIILIIPFVGAILYFLIGREGAKSF